MISLSDRLFEPHPDLIVGVAACLREAEAENRDAIDVLEESLVEVMAYFEANPHAKDIVIEEATQDNIGTLARLFIEEAIADDVIFPKLVASGYLLNLDGSKVMVQ